MGVTKTLKDELVCQIVAT